MKNFTKFSFLLFMGMMFMALSTSCGKDNDDDPKPGNSIVGTWTYSDDSEGPDFYDDYTLVFKSDNTGYIKNEWGSRGSGSEMMYFDWSLTTASDGSYRLSVIYISGDRYMDGPFGEGYAQWNRTVTIAGSTLSINMGDGTVMLFRRK